MNLAPHLRAGRPASSPLWLACLVALSGCGGATYGIGTIPGDGGKDAEGGAPSGFCMSQGTGGCDGGGNSGFAGDDGGSGLAFGDDGGKSGFAGDDGGATSAGCTLAPIACTGGATGYACPPVVKPTEAHPNLSCTSGVIGGYGVEFCCFPWPSGSACTPDETFPCNGSYPYQCTPGTTPSDVDSTLSCGNSFPGSNGQNEFCCTYP